MSWDGLEGKIVSLREMSRVVATLTSFGSPAERKRVRKSDFVVKANAGAVTIATDWYDLDNKTGVVVQRASDNADNETAWEDYSNFTWSGTIVDNGTTTPVADEALTFTDEDDEWDSEGPEGQSSGAWGGDFVIETEDIGDLAVTAQNIANATITATQIANATITATQIANATITATQIANATITGTQIANATITGTHIQNASITGADIGSATITATNIANATITATQIANATITGTQIASATIAGSNIASGTITATNIQDATITGGKIASATITSGNIASGTITGGNIASGTITAGNLADLTITAGKIANLTITAAQIANLTITGGPAGKIATSTITEDNIVANTITANSIASGAITTDELAANAVTAAKILAGTITADRLAANIITSQYLYLGAYGGIPYNVGEALLLAHFDGARPYETDYTGNLNGHRGQAPNTNTGGVIFRPGKFGKGVQIAETATNLITNPSLETNTTNWSANGVGTTIAQSSASSYIGANCLQVNIADAASAGVNIHNGTYLAATAGAAYTFSIYGYVVGEASYLATITIHWLNSSDTEIGTSTKSITLASSWSRFYLSATAPANTAKCWIQITRGVTGTHTLRYDAAQFEAGAYPTPYLDGALGNGHSWNGTSHASTSTRTVANLQYRTDGNLNALAGTVLAWIHCDATNVGSNQYVFRAKGTTAGNIILRISASGALEGYWGTGSLSGGAVGVGTHLLALTYDGTTLTLYLDGAALASGSASGFSGMPSTFYVGNSSFDTEMLNGVLDELCVLPNALTSTEIRAIYDSNAPVIAEGNNAEWRVTSSAAEVWGNANGIFARNVNGVASFALLNADGINSNTWGGASETLNSGDALLGSNASGKANLFWDASTGQLNFRGGTTTNLYIDTSGKMTYVADAGSHAKWVTATGQTLGELWAGASGGFGSMVMVGRGKDATDTHGVAKWIAYKHDNSQTSALEIASYGSVTFTGRDGQKGQVLTGYARDFAGGVTVQNTNVETTIYSATVKGNAMGATGILTCELGGDLQNSSGGTIVLTFRVKFGGTTVATLKVSVANFAGTGGYFIRARVGNNGNTNAQRNFAMLIASKNGSWDGTSADYAGAAINTTSDQTLSITAQWASANANAGVFSKGGLVEIQRAD